MLWIIGLNRVPANCHEGKASRFNLAGGPHQRREYSAGLPFNIDRRVTRSRAVWAIRQATSRKAREVVHPQLFRFNVKRQTRGTLPAKVVHPPQMYHYSVPISVEY
jgi:hypothetical protein